MPLPWASQDTSVKLFAVVSSIAVGVMAVLAGIAVLMLQHLVINYDLDLPRLSALIDVLGLWGVVAGWVLYMIVLVVLLGYPRNEIRDMVGIVVFGVIILYYFVAVVGSLLPVMNGTKSVM